MIQVKFPGHYITHELWPHDSNLVKINDPIRTQFCTCHNSLAVVTCANLWPDCINTIEITVATISPIFQLWFYKVFVKWTPGHSHLSVKPAVISIFSRGLILWHIMEILQFAFLWGDSRGYVYQQYLSMAFNPSLPELFVRNMNVYMHFAISCHAIICRLCCQGISSFDIDLVFQLQGLGNGTWPDSAKPLPESMLTCFLVTPSAVNFMI